MIKLIKQILSAIGLDGYIWNLYQKILHFKHYYRMGFPAGHFYSPIPSIDEVRENRESIFVNIKRHMDGVDINEEFQLSILNEFEQYWESVFFPKQKTKGLRYYTENKSFGYGDAAILSVFLRHFKPKRLIEVGSGLSSGVILDTNEKYLDSSVECTFIEPYPEVLFSILKDSDMDATTIIEEKIQDVDLGIFYKLEAGDFLFIDSSHVSKINSDVNCLFFEVLPNLAEGVIVHFHDISHNFEYPEEWIYKGWAWNENYLLRAFLQYNNKFEIIFFNNYIGRYHMDKLIDKLPEYNSGGSIWLRKK